MNPEPPSASSSTPVVFRAGVLPGPEFDVRALLEDVARARAIPELAGAVQIGFVHQPGAAEPYRTGVGSLWDSKQNHAMARESEFTEFHRDWRGTAIEDAYHRLAEFSGFKLARFRLFILGPRRCHSFHRDTEIRLHIPLVTSPQALFLFRDRPPIHFQANGQAYWADTRNAHSAMNGHETEERIHLVASALETPRQSFDDFIAVQSRIMSKALGLPVSS